jgi:hypothetical protein
MERIHLPLFAMLAAVVLLWGALGMARVLADRSTSRTSTTVNGLVKEPRHDCAEFAAASWQNT